MTGPTPPRGVEGAGERNRAAIDRLENDLLPSVREAIYDVLAAILDALTTGAGVPPTEDAAAVAARAGWRTGLERIVAWVTDAFTRLVTRAADVGAEYLPDGLPDALPDDLPDDTVDVAPEIDGPDLEDYVQAITGQLADDLRDVPDTIAAQTATTLREGYQAGDTPDELQARVAETLGRDRWDYEAERIARTTTTTVYNAAHTAAANELEASLGEPLRRIWIATQDTRTRPSHAKAHAQVIASGQRFRVGESWLRFPGDPLGPAEEVINCRCVVAPVADDLVIDLAHRVAGRTITMPEDMPEDTPIAAADRQVTDTVIDEYSDGYAVDRSGVPGITAEDLAAADTTGDGPRWPVDPGEWPGADEDALSALSRIPPQLRRYWTQEEGAAKIGWGTEGSFRRCQAALAEYVSPAQLDGLCANLYHSATGRWPGANRGTAAAAGQGCGCGDLTDDEARVAAAEAQRVRAAVGVCQACRFDIVPGDHSGSDCVANTAAAAVAAAMPDARARLAVQFRDRLAAALDIPRWMLKPADQTPVSAGQGVPARGAGGMSAATLDDARQGAMVALALSGADAARLAVDGDGAIPADELHVTLLFLGDGADWEGTEPGAELAALVEAVAGQVAPVNGRLWQVGATVGQDPVAMYLVGDDTGRLAGLRGAVLSAAEDRDVPVPPQHSPFVAHISTRYGNASAEGMDQGGTDVVFDRLRVSYGPQNVDFPLAGTPSADDNSDNSDNSGGDSAELEDSTMNDTMNHGGTTAAVATAMVQVPSTIHQVQLAAAAATGNVLARAAAAAPERPPAAWFRPVELSGPTPPTVTAQGRVWGHLGQSVNADGSPRCHVGITDECVPIPPTRTSYGAFHRDELLTAEGDTVAVGYLYTGCDHSEGWMDLDEARGHLDTACTRTAAGRVYDTAWGPVFVGSLLPGVTAGNVAALHKMSGEWYTAPLELHAAVGVSDAGFPVDGTEDAVLVADEDPVPLAASAHVAAAPDTGDLADEATPDNESDGGDGDGGCDCADSGGEDDCDCQDREDQDEDAPVPVPTVATVATADTAAAAAAVTAIDQYRAGRARQTSDPVVTAAALNRARRRVGRYRKRG